MQKEQHGRDQQREQGRNNERGQRMRGGRERDDERMQGDDQSWQRDERYASFQGEDVDRDRYPDGQEFRSRGGNEQFGGPQRYGQSFQGGQAGQRSGYGYQGAGGEYRGGQYGSGQYGSGQYGGDYQGTGYQGTGYQGAGYQSTGYQGAGYQGQYGAGQYGSGQYGSGQYGSGQYGSRDQRWISSNERYDRGGRFSGESDRYSKEPSRGGQLMHQDDYSWRSLEQPGRGYDDRMFSSDRMRGQDDERSLGDRVQDKFQDYGRRIKEFFGRGPKGYVRSDERIREEVAERLSQGYLDASEIELTVANGEVVLLGFVTDKRAKRLAEDIVENTLGVKDIDNRLKVKKESHQGSETSQAALSGSTGSPGTGMGSTGSGTSGAGTSTSGTRRPNQSS